MNTEVLHLFLALAILAALGIWMNIKAGDLITTGFSAGMVLVGTVGMVYLVGAALIA